MLRTQEIRIPQFDLKPNTIMYGISFIDNIHKKRKRKRKKRGHRIRFIVRTYVFVFVLYI